MMRSSRKRDPGAMRGPSIAAAKGRGVATTPVTGGAATRGPGPSAAGGSGPRAASTSRSTRSMLPGEPPLPPPAMARAERLQAQDPKGSRHRRPPGRRDSPRPTSAHRCAGGRQRRASTGPESLPCSCCPGGARGAAAPSSILRRRRRQRDPWAWGASRKKWH
jgi:hypothetical protein